MPWQTCFTCSSCLVLLPVSSQIQYELCTPMFNINYSTTASYMLEIYQRSSDSCLCSVAHRHCIVSTTCRHFTVRCLTVAGMHCCRTLDYCNRRLSLASSCDTLKLYVLCLVISTAHIIVWPYGTTGPPYSSLLEWREMKAVCNSFLMHLFCWLVGCCSDGFLMSVFGSDGWNAECLMIAQCWADQEGRKALSKNNARGLTTLKQRCKKYVRDYKFDMTLAEYRQVCRLTLFIGLSSWLRHRVASNICEMLIAALLYFHQNVVFSVLLNMYYWPFCFANGKKLATVLLNFIIMRYNVKMSSVGEYC